MRLPQLRQFWEQSTWPFSRPALDFGEDKPVWIPKSIAEFDEDDGVLTIPEPLAQEKGLI